MVDKIRRIDRSMSNTHHFVQRLAAEREGDGTMLDKHGRLRQCDQRRQSTQPR